MKLLMLERIPRSELEIERGYNQARVILFDVEEDTGHKSIHDIFEALSAWEAVNFMLTRHAWCIPEGIAVAQYNLIKGTTDLDDALKWKTRDIQLRRVLAKLEAHYKTGLSLAKPPDKFQRDKNGRFTWKTRDVREQAHEDGVSFDVSDAEGKIIHQIAVRAVETNRHLDMLEVEMDLTACHANGCRLRLDDLLKADRFNFMHDVLGINQHIDRTTGRLSDHFLPRFVLNQSEISNDQVQSTQAGDATDHANHV